MKKLLQLNYNDDYWKRLGRDFMMLSGPRIYPPFMEVGEVGWTTHWDDTFTSLSKIKRGTQEVMVVKTGPCSYELHYPDRPNIEVESFRNTLIDFISNWK